MTSRRPDRSQVWNFIDANPLTVQATPGHFRDHGYLTLGLGKTFHEQGGAWNADAYYNTSFLPYFPYQTNQCPHGGEGGGHCILPDDEIWDYSLRLKTVEYIRAAAEHYRNTSQPFFIMTGFRDPHAPWAAPQRMYDLYDQSQIKVPTHKTLGEGTPLIAWSPELNVMLANGTSFPWSYDRPVPDWVNRDQRHAYYAAASYVDEHVGALLTTLEDEGVRNNTIVVFHADHGYALGEHGEWEKKSNFDMIIRVPLLFSVPGRAGDAVAGSKTAALLDLVDIFPTLSTLAGLPVPAGVDGIDQSSVVLGGAKRMAAPLRDAAYHQYPSCGTPTFNHTRQQCNNVPKHEFDAMGYSVRTAEWRYTIWLMWDKERLVPRWDGDFAEELYDHRGDDSTSFDRWENVNLAAQEPATAARLRQKLRAFFEKH